MSNFLIVASDPGMVEFIRRERPKEFASAPHLAWATADDVRDKIVAGVLSIHLAAKTRFYISVGAVGDGYMMACYLVSPLKDWPRHLLPADFADNSAIRRDGRWHVDPRLEEDVL